MPLMFHEVPIACINQAAEAYQVPAPLIMAIILTENGEDGTQSKNNNGSYDLGIMQINTTWAPRFKHSGYTLNEVTNDPCKNVYVGTWILSRCISENSDLISAIGDYHSHTPAYNLKYAQKVIEKYHQINTQIKPYLSPHCAQLGLVC
jgi:soluble lytic murein transglycosylase-like protein